MQVLTGKISNLVTRVFGCWHAELSRPFSRGGRAYRKCLSCGAQRRFNLGNWEMQGKFFTAIKHGLHGLITDSAV